MGQRGGIDKTTVDTVQEDLFEVRETALALAGNNDVNIDDVFFMESLSDVETNIKKLNEYSDKCWLLSSILLYSLVYNKKMYEQSGLLWQEYIAQSKQRLGMANDEISRQLSGARFFIAHYKALQRAGWSPSGSARKLASGQIALELCGDIDEVIKHLVNDSWRSFHDWYMSFKVLPPVVEVEDKRPDIVYSKGSVTVGGKSAFTIADDLPDELKSEIQGYVDKITKALKNGNYPAIVECYDEKEGKHLTILRDKYRNNK